MSNILAEKDDKAVSSSSLDIPSTEKNSSNSQAKEQVSTTSTSPPSITNSKELDDGGKEGSLKSKNGENSVVEDESLYLTGAKLGLVMVGLCMAGLLVGLVRRTHISRSLQKRRLLLGRITQFLLLQFRPSQQPSTRLKMLVGMVVPF